MNPDAPEVADSSPGRNDGAKELLRVLRIFCEFVRGFRALHFAGPCGTVFGSARFSESYPYSYLVRAIAERSPFRLWLVVLKLSRSTAL